MLSFPSKGGQLAAGTGFLSKDELRPFEKLSSWRSVLSILLSWAVVAAAIWLAKVSVYLYPLSLLLIANRQLALTLIGHEGLHGTLFRNRWLNDLVGRYFCHFPVFISFSRYRAKHLVHHGNVGTPADTDLGLYSVYPVAPGVFFSMILLRTLRGRVFWDFLNYYVEIPAFFRGEVNPFIGRLSVFRSSDLPQYLLFHGLLLWFLCAQGVLAEYLLLWVIPLVVSLPYNFFIGGLQHGPMPRGVEVDQRARTVTGPKWLMEILLPVDINFHAEHHLYPTVPHFRLRELSRFLEERKVPLWRESYCAAVAHLMPRS